MEIAQVGDLVRKSADHLIYYTRLKETSGRDGGAVCDGAVDTSTALVLKHVVRCVDNNLLCLLWNEKIVYIETSFAKIIQRKKK
jgi:hypothetical protein